MASEVQRQLLRRLQKVVKEWPADPSRKGRDLGEFLKKIYMPKFKQECQADPTKGLAAVENLERLNSNHYRKLYPREREFAFSGEITVKNPWVLSNENMSYMQKKSRSLWEKFTHRKRTNL